MVDTGKKVICGGLDIDYRGEPFEVTMRIASIADETLKLHAVCTNCGKDAWISHRLVNKEDRIVVGGTETYTALCRECYKKATAKR